MVMSSAILCQDPLDEKDKRGLDVIEQDILSIDKTPEVNIPRGYALIVGIAKYRNLPAAAQLHYSERDAESIYSILISPEGGNFKAENVHKLIGSNATLSRLRQELESWLPSVAEDEDRVLIYFAGHGFVSDNRAFLAPYDINLKDISDSGYPMDDLGRVIGSRIKAKWKVLLTDACHSGAITPDTDALTINHRLLDLNRSMFSLTASRDREQSFESPQWGGGHGIFTYYVVQGLKGYADEDKNGIVTADELSEYVHRNVREATGGKQNPTSERGSFDPEMLLSYNPTFIPPNGPDHEYGALVIESNMNGVEIFLDSKTQGVVNKDRPLRLPGLPAGVHIIQGIKMGYEPDGPREITVYPGQDITVTIKILIPVVHPKKAVDYFQRGLEYYTRGDANNYKKAAAEFSRALDVYPNYSQAALFLGRTYNALFEQDKAEQYMRRAIEIDRDYMEARASLGGMLLDIGDVDESIRQLNAVIQREPDHDLAHYLLAQAYRIKELYPQSIDEARKAISIKPGNSEPHFWLAESLRMSGQFEEAETEYLQYLKLSDFDSGVGGKLNYWVKGFLIGKGKKTQSSQRDIWKDLRSLAHFGVCDCELNLKRLDSAIEFCQKSLRYDPHDPYTHYLLGAAYAMKFNESDKRENLAAALNHFHTMLEINEYMVEAEEVQEQIALIEIELKKPH